MSSFNAIFSPIIVVFHCEVENRFYFTFKGVQGVKKSFQEVKIKILNYKTNILRKKFSFHAIFLSNIVVYYYPSKKSFFFYIHRFPGGKNFPVGKNHQILHKNNQYFQYCNFRFRSRYNM